MECKHYLSYLYYVLWSALSVQWHSISFQTTTINYKHLDKLFSNNKKVIIFKEIKCILLIHCNKLLMRAAIRYRSFSQVGLKIGKPLNKQFWSLYVDNRQSTVKNYKKKGFPMSSMNRKSVLALAWDCLIIFKTGVEQTNLNLKLKCNLHTVHKQNTTVKTGFQSVFVGDRFIICSRHHKSKSKRIIKGELKPVFTHLLNVCVFCFVWVFSVFAYVFGYPRDSY